MEKFILLLIVDWEDSCHQFFMNVMTDKDFSISQITMKNDNIMQYNALLLCMKGIYSIVYNSSDCE